VKTLYICRHAKSSWADPGMRDFDRPLNQRGLKDAPDMAQRFVERLEPVDLLVSSPAERAITTAREYARTLLRENRLVQEPRIYEASVPALLRIISNLPPDAHAVMLFGHNPGFTELVAHLSGQDIGNLPTSGIARVDVEVDDWDAVSRDTGRLVWLDYPKLEG
jgi:phosphohistidine phosphatase